MANEGEESAEKSYPIRNSSACDNVKMDCATEFASGSTTTQPFVNLRSRKRKNPHLVVKLLSQCLQKQCKKHYVLTSGEFLVKPLPVKNMSPLFSASTQRKCRFQYSSSSQSKLTPTTSDVTQCPPASTQKALLSSGGKVVKRKKRRSRLCRVKRQEYNKLREMVPALQEKNKVSKVVVIEEAIKYIDELHTALVQRFKARDNPVTFNGVYLDPREIDGRNIRELVRRLLANANPTTLPPATIENIRTTPSFWNKLPKPK